MSDDAGVNEPGDNHAISDLVGAAGAGNNRVL
jgi:hypothetical protein